MTNHKQVRVAGIEVDEGLAELLLLLWRDGITTNFSCQGKPDAAMILFPSVPDALAFMEGTLRRTGFHGCFSHQLTMTMAEPLDDIHGWGVTQFSDPERRIRAIVRWPFEFTEIWTAAWRGEPYQWEQALDIAAVAKMAANA